MIEKGKAIKSHVVVWHESQHLHALCDRYDFLFLDLVVIFGLVLKLDFAVVFGVEEAVWPLETYD